MAKWTFTDAGAKRIFTAYLTAEDRGCCYHRLRRALQAEDQRGYNAMGRMLAWIGEHHPKQLPQLASDASRLYEGLREKSLTYLSAFDALSQEVDYEHWHAHDKEQE